MEDNKILTENFLKAEKEAEILEINGEFDENAELRAYEEEKIKKIIEETKTQISEIYKTQEILSRNLVKKMFWSSDNDSDLTEKLAEKREKTGKELKSVLHIFSSKMHKITESEEVFSKASEEILLYAGAKFLDKEMGIQEEKEKNYVYTDNGAN